MQNDALCHEMKRPWTFAIFMRRQTYQSDLTELVHSSKPCLKYLHFNSEFFLDKHASFTVNI